jgi:hypothetical protein
VDASAPLFVDWSDRSDWSSGDGPHAVSVGVVLSVVPVVPVADVSVSSVVLVVLVLVLVEVDETLDESGARTT